MKIADVAAITCGEIFGDRDLDIRGVAGIEEAGAGDITYLSDKKFAPKLHAGEASAVLVKEYSGAIAKTQIVVRNPQYAFALLLKAFNPVVPGYEGVSEAAVVSENALLGKNVTVYPLAYISDSVTIGDNSVIYPGVFIGSGSFVGEGCIIYPSVTIREGVRIGNRVIIHPGAVIGADGFGYVFENGAHHKIPQVGGVVIEDDVEIGANTTVDRATTGNTVISAGTKLDNLVQVGHNVKVGKASILVAQVGIGGSTVIGDGVVLAGQAGIADHAEIEAGTVVGAQAGVTGRLAKGMYLGSPARPYRDVLKSVDLFHRLPELKNRIVELERKLAELTKDGGQQNTQVKK